MARALMEAAGGGEGVYRVPMADEEIPLKGFPTLARRTDLAPNGAGAGALGYRRVGGVDGTGGLESLEAFEGTILVVGDGLADQSADFGASAGLFIYVGTHMSEAAANADFVLPGTTFAESEGTLTNVQGRVQRFWQGIMPSGMARPAWLVLGALVAELTEGEFASSADACFAQVAAANPAFGGLDYESIGTRGALMNEPVQLAGD